MRVEWQQLVAFEIWSTIRLGSMAWRAPFRLVLPKETWEKTVPPQLRCGFLSFRAGNRFETTYEGHPIRSSPNSVPPDTLTPHTQQLVPRKRVASWSKVVKNDTYSAAADASQVGCLRRYQNCSVNWERQIPDCGWSSYWLSLCGIITHYRQNCTWYDGWLMTSVKYQCRMSLHKVQTNPNRLMPPYSPVVFICNPSDRGSHCWAKICTSAADTSLKSSTFSEGLDTPLDGNANELVLIQLDPWLLYGNVHPKVYYPMSRLIW